jgi:hypothetical protein
MQTKQAPVFGLPPRLTWSVLWLLPMVLTPRPGAAAEERTGEQVYRQLCVKCHGASGEGTKEHFPYPLVGDRSVASLARLIARTMPEDNPGKLAAADAEKVAAYIHEAFYSKSARARNQPPRLELARLTVGQYRQAIADLVGTFRTPGQWDDAHGLRGEYYRARGGRGARPVLSRVDPAIRFDFGTSSPDPEKLDALEFTIRWAGSVLAPETGPYEFIIRTEHSARLWVNDARRPLIDAWVKSGTDTEYRASIFLLAGRAYPLRLEFSKARQGVNDAKNNKPRPPAPASLALEWKLPQQAAAVIPPRNLSPNTFPETLVVATPFPPDDRSAGFERGTSISQSWHQATTEAAIEVADYVVAHLPELAGLADGALDRESRLRDFSGRFAERAFRRPLTDEQRQFFIDRQFVAAADPETAVKRVVLLVLKSPRFLYREVDGRDPFDVACRLSFGLWDSLPDQELLDAAAAGQLVTRDQVARQAERMVTDPRARSKLREFFLRWLKVDHAPDLAKDPQRFPDFDQAVISDLWTSLELFLEEVLSSEAADFRQLLLADHLHLNGRLARIYGADLPPEAPFQRVAVDPGRRAGVLTHPYLMASFAYTEESSPIHRGVFLARSVLGLPLRPPPEAFTPLAPDLHPELTTRERVALQTRPQACLTCHGVINPLGFSLEHYDAIGRLRAREKGKPIDATGSYQTRSGAVVQFAGVRDLAMFLAGSEEVHAAFVEQLFHHLVKQPIRAFGPQTLADLRQAFAGQDYNIRKLVVAILAASALPARPQEATTGDRGERPPRGGGPSRPDR